MAKRDMKKALGASLKAEEQAVSSRFEKAGTLLAEKEPAPRGRPEPEGAGEAVGDNFKAPDGDDGLLSRVKGRCSKAGISADEGEVLRAGLSALDGMKGRELRRLFKSLRRVKTVGPARETPALFVRRAYTVSLRSALHDTPFQSGRKITILYRES